ncbi:MAG: dipeptide epimerase [Clostridiales bacterium]|jgi:L-alanine-DL-glutamate epimerase-like enolase superfamily enzyme|nr:dipeptide epimerase [Clostridiales bacterium]
MKITRVTTRPLSAALKKPFITAKRAVEKLENILVTVHAADLAGYGEAACAREVTGETQGSVAEAVHQHIAPAIIGADPRDIHDISRRISKAVEGNSAAKCGVECAAYDLFAKTLGVPLYRALGGSVNTLANDITISADTEEEMIKDALSALEAGFKTLKIKLGRFPETDGQTLINIWRSILGYYPRENPDRDESASRAVSPVSRPALRVDANQGWTPGIALQFMRKWDSENTPVELIEQPVPADDLSRLSFVTSHAKFPVYADESVFSARDAREVLERRAANGVNIKLAKSGGIAEAWRVKTLCDIYGAHCLVGCVLESRLGASAAAHFAAAAGITRVDLDGPFLLAEDPFTGGPVFQGGDIRFTEEPGIGLEPTGKWREPSAGEIETARSSSE